MKDLARFNLLWLCHAMTASVTAEELYYYDGRSKKFFSTKPSPVNRGEQEVFDMVDLAIIAPCQQHC